MIVSCEEMRRVERSLGKDAAELMEEAGWRMARAVEQFFPEPGRCEVFFGKGHNGGDALVAARHLRRGGWAVNLHACYPEAAWAALTREQYRQFSELLPREQAGRCVVVLDGLLGIGARGVLREPVLGAVREINRLRREEGAAVFALDAPTGVDADTGEAADEAVTADFTLCVGLAKRGLLEVRALNRVGRLAVLPLSSITGYDAPETVATPQSLAGLLPRRPFDMHKGDAGRVGIVAGSCGLAGAAVMTANAAVRAGAGLVTLFVPPEIYVPVAARAMPEVMVSPVENFRAVLERSFDVLAVGPGLGRDHAAEVSALCEQFAGPMVIDADALHILAKNRDVLNRAKGPRLLTPHPGEMARLFPESAGLSYRETAARFLAQHPVTLLLKGARTLVAEGARRSWNTTGHPGMATGGMGDVLTGVCAALAGQGLALFDAARLGAWLCGRAAECAVSHGGQSRESLAATDLLAEMGRAFRDYSSTASSC